MERIVALVDDATSDLGTELKAALEENGDESQIGRSGNARRAAILLADDSPAKTHRVRRVKNNEELQKEMHTCCELADVAQTHLDYTTWRFQWLWLHQVA